MVSLKTCYSIGIVGGKNSSFSFHYMSWFFVSSSFFMTSPVDLSI